MDIVSKEGWNVALLASVGRQSKLVREILMIYGVDFEALDMSTEVLYNLVGNADCDFMSKKLTEAQKVRPSSPKKLPESHTHEVALKLKRPNNLVVVNSSPVQVELSPLVKHMPGKRLDTLAELLAGPDRK
eukprot:CAMPEP_0196591842 /NCGR_PEP_ID=MMETSP1081-20130531/71071_1 /TAXON_ID=36882 /ORGANISM="Pyramimonas amylifera, Strain CCMP720" /LENGTH=130 /DNA_ID=CAMNT_0041915349 /DNA_START=380 /DNA_END=772 /DNA_ORIENTATION=-